MANEDHAGYGEKQFRLRNTSMPTFIPIGLFTLVVSGACTSLHAGAEFEKTMRTVIAGEEAQRYEAIRRIIHAVDNEPNLVIVHQREFEKWLSHSRAEARTVAFVCFKTAGRRLIGKSKTLLPKLIAALDTGDVLWSQMILEQLDGDSLPYLIDVIKKKDKVHLARVVAIESLYWMGKVSRPAVPTLEELVSSQHPADKRIQPYAAAMALNLGSKNMPARILLEKKMEGGDWFSSLSLVNTGKAPKKAVTILANALFEADKSASLKYSIIALSHTNGERQFVIAALEKRLAVFKKEIDERQPIGVMLDLEFVIEASLIRIDPTNKKSLQYFKDNEKRILDYLSTPNTELTDSVDRLLAVELVGNLNLRRAIPQLEKRLEIEPLGRIRDAIQDVLTHLRK